MDLVSTLPESIQEAARHLRDGTLSSESLVMECCRRADLLDDSLGVYISRFTDEALAAARQADVDLRAGVDRGPLQGIPIGVKDCLACAEGPTTAHSLASGQGWGIGKDATAVHRLRASGAVITGKATMMEFGAGFPDRDKPFPFPRNPWDPSRWAGGSSSGSASGVIAGMFLGALGTDAGGSIRIPSAFCGATGLKPTYGRVPTGVSLPLTFTLDHIGTIASSAWDCAALFDAIAGFDPSDSTSAEVPTPGVLSSLEDASDLQGLRVGVLREHHFLPGGHPELPALFDGGLNKLTSLGARVTEVTLPLYREVVGATFITALSETLAYHQKNLSEHWHDYSASMRDLLGLGAALSGSDYVQAQRVRRLGQRALADVFRAVDVIVTPTVGIVAPTYEEIEQAGALALGRIMGAIHTGYWDCMGNPVLAVPLGLTSEGLPLSMQLAGRPFEEQVILRTGHALQEISDWHCKRPDTISPIN